MADTVEDLRAGMNLLSQQCAAQSERAMKAEAAAGKILRDLDVANNKLAAWKARAEEAEKRVVGQELMLQEARRQSTALERIAVACELGSGWKKE